ncbi:MAG: bifunctional hydroxymethylpyrimidine kinase/phosphomethylpyrimidine kinase [Oscillospiraceae bacterium]|nr:bifunctional hydroxymethylpyrimidine kinase/phosphomethylpyrimidine kinase [Oscillospiraceae bacterium]
MAMVVVAGGVNVDIGARCAEKLRMKDSNPGCVRTHLGGVGRNIAHNLALLGVETELMTALGGDEHAKSVRAACAAQGIGLAHALRVPEGRTSTYVYISDAQGDMAVAVSDMAICERLTPDYFAENLALLNAAALVVADTNLPEASLAYLAGHLRVPLFIDPVSVAKAEKLAGLLPSIHTLKPNAAEAELLSGVPVVDRNSARRAARRLIDLGVKRVFLSLGKEGFLAAAEDETVWQPAPEAQVVSTTGAGDALMAAIAWAYLRGENLTRTAALGAAAAAITIECAETISPDLGAEAVLARAETEYA